MIRCIEFAGLSEDFQKDFDVYKSTGEGGDSRTGGKGMGEHNTDINCLREGLVGGMQVHIHDGQDWDGGNSRSSKCQFRE